jgi:hypothetical protein
MKGRLVDQVSSYLDQKELKKALLADQDSVLVMLVKVTPLRR